MLLIFALLAIPLRSYTKPFIIMAVIPFGFIGVILGHWVLGVALSAISFMGIFGLSGVVVNDSLVMIDFIDQRIGEGALARTGDRGGRQGALSSDHAHFRDDVPRLHAPYLERAIQAQFLIPFAASLGCGILFTTAILMMIVPALYTIHLRLIASRGHSRRRYRVMHFTMQGGRNRWLILPKV